MAEKAVPSIVLEDEPPAVVPIVIIVAKLEGILDSNLKFFIKFDLGLPLSELNPKTSKGIISCFSGTLSKSFFSTLLLPFIGF